MKKWQNNNKSSGWPKPGRDKYLKKENEPLQASRRACPVDHDGQQVCYVQLFPKFCSGMIRTLHWLIIYAWFFVAENFRILNSCNMKTHLPRSSHWFTKGKIKSLKSIHPTFSILDKIQCQSLSFLLDFRMKRTSPLLWYIWKENPFVMTRFDL